MNIDHLLRRICNHPLLTRIRIYELAGGEIVDASPGDPYDRLLDPSLHSAALTNVAGYVRGRT